MKKLLAACVLVAVACGGSDEGGDAESNASDAAETMPAAGAAAAAAPAAQGTVHEVRMLLTDEGSYVYQPTTLTIRAGDRVRWINVSGGPHNVAFYADRIPAGAATVLNAAMANKISDLSGALMIAADAAYEVSFAGAPAGQYDYYCTPHLALNMVASLTVTE